MRGLRWLYENEPRRSKETRPFLVDINCGDRGKNLCMLYRQEGNEYSRLYGFNYRGVNGNAIPCPCEVFRGPVRFTQGLGVPWVVFSDSSYEEALRVVKQHGHPKSRVHPLTHLLAKPPKMIWVARHSYNLRKRGRDKK